MTRKYRLDNLGQTSRPITVPGYLPWDPETSERLHAAALQQLNARNLFTAELLKHPNTPIQKSAAENETRPVRPAVARMAQNPALPRRDETSYLAASRYASEDDRRRVDRHQHEARRTRRKGRGRPPQTPRYPGKSPRGRGARPHRGTHRRGTGKLRTTRSRAQSSRRRPTHRPRERRLAAGTNGREDHRETAQRGPGRQERQGGRHHGWATRYPTTNAGRKPEPDRRGARPPRHRP